MDEEETENENRSDTEHGFSVSVWRDMATQGEMKRNFVERKNCSVFKGWMQGLEWLI